MTLRQAFISAFEYGHIVLFLRRFAAEQMPGVMRRGESDLAFCCCDSKLVYIVYSPALLSPLLTECEQLLLCFSCASRTVVILLVPYL